MSFKLFGVSFYVSYALLCMLAVCVIFDMLTGFTVCAFAVAVHEAGHIFMMALLGFPPESIKLSPFEILISDRGRERRSVGKNFLIIIFGPLFNFICFILFYLLYLLYGFELRAFALANLSLGLFNMLPVLSLDGGQLLLLLLSRRLSVYRSERIIDALTFASVFPLAALGFMLLFNSRYNFSLLFICVYLIFSLIFKNNGYI